MQKKADFLAAAWTSILGRLLQQEASLAGVPELAFETVFYLGVQYALQRPKGAVLAEAKTWFAMLERGAFGDLDSSPGIQHRPESPAKTGRPKEAH